MKCPKCGIEMRITSTRTQVEGDKSPATQTRVFTVQDLTCVNPQCENSGKTVQQTRHLIYEDAARERVEGTDLSAQQKSDQA